MTFENKWGEGKQEGKKKLLHISAHTKDEKSRLDTTIKHDGEMERKREGVHVINEWGGETGKEQKLLHTFVKQTNKSMQQRGKGRVEDNTRMGGGKREGCCLEKNGKFTAQYRRTQHGQNQMAFYRAVHWSSRGREIYRPRTLSSSTSNSPPPPLPWGR